MLPERTRRRRPHRIAVINRKGGVGKTATTANVAACLARRGFRVLVVDSDSQRNLTTQLGDPNRPATAATIDHAYRAPKKYALEAVGPSSIAGVDLLYGDTAIEDTEKELIAGQHPNAGGLLERVLRIISEQREYDFILIDCPPSSGLLTRNAIIVADVLVMPILTDHAGFEGAGRLKELLLKLEAQGVFDERPVPPVYAFPYMVDERVPRSKELRDYIASPEFEEDNQHELIELHVLRNGDPRNIVEIHHNSAVPDAYGESKSVFEFERLGKNGKVRKNEKSVMRAREEFERLAEAIANVCA